MQTLLSAPAPTLLAGEVPGVLRKGGERQRKKARGWCEQGDLEESGGSILTACVSRGVFPTGKWHLSNCSYL
jgi:hypothetical protein